MVTLCDELVVDAMVATLQADGEATVRLWGRSMLPTFWPGTRHRVEACEPEDVRVGDVVVIRRGAGVTAHRVAAVDGGDLAVKGDRFPREGALSVPAGAVLGRITSVPVGPIAISLPASLGRRVHRVMAPLLASAQPGVERSMVWGRAVQRELLARSIPLRRRALPWRVERLSEAHLPRIRAALHRRGVRAERRDLERWQELARAELPFAMVATGRRGRVVGWIRADQGSDGEVELYDLWVERLHRRLGLGSALMGAAEARAFALGAARVTADTSEARGDILRLFATRGFSATTDASVGPRHRRYARARER